jgi:hypothetical protein
MRHRTSLDDRPLSREVETASRYSVPSGTLRSRRVQAWSGGAMAALMDLVRGSVRGPWLSVGTGQDMDVSWAGGIGDSLTTVPIPRGRPARTRCCGDSVLVAASGRMTLPMGRSGRPPSPATSSVSRLVPSIARARRLASLPRRSSSASGTGRQSSTWMDLTGSVVAALSVEGGRVVDGWWSGWRLPRTYSVTARSRRSRDGPSMLAATLGPRPPSGRRGWACRCHHRRRPGEPQPPRRSGVPRSEGARAQRGRSDRTALHG